MKDSKVIVKLKIPRSRPDDVVLPGRRRILLALLASVVLAVLVAGHAVYWYLPRLRAASPGRGLPAQLLANTDLPFAVWMPFPHQNLAMLERATEQDHAATDFSKALARLAGVPEPSLPAFGTFRVPPSNEITFACDEDGERFAVAAEVYPAVAAFAKLAGRLANNLWLRGGELTVDGRSVEVAWHGRVWTVSSPAMPDLDALAKPSPGPPSLLVAEARQVDPPIPPGRFHLTRDGSDLVLKSDGEDSGKTSFDVPDLARSRLFLLLVSGGNKEKEEPVQAMAFFAREAPLTFSQEGVSYEFPGMASIWETGGERWTLPGESLLKWSGRKARRREIGPLSVSAIDRRSFNRIQKLAPRLAPMVKPRPGGRLAWGLWLDLEAGHLEISRIARAMEEIPLVSRQRKQRWQDTATVLGPVARAFSRLSVVVTDEPAALELRFVGRAAPP